MIRTCWRFRSPEALRFDRDLKDGEMLGARGGTGAEAVGSLLGAVKWLMMVYNDG